MWFMTPKTDSKLEKIEKRWYVFYQIKWII